MRVATILRTCAVLGFVAIAHHPQVRLSGSLIGSYFEGRYTVSEHAYVLVVAVDLDRQLRVLYPASPRDSGFVARDTPQRLAPLYPRLGANVQRVARLSADAGGPKSLTAEFGTSGGIIVIASREPLDFGPLTAPDGSWNAITLRETVMNTSVSGARQALGESVTGPTQSFSSDHLVRIFR